MRKKSPVPKWLFKVKDGDYSLKELAEMNKEHATQNAVYKTMRRLYIPKTYTHHPSRTAVLIKYQIRQKDIQHFIEEIEKNM
jgi:predicted DNA-binding protein YlxM (UPF0122 family)